MRKFGVILFGLALGLSVVRPAPAAAYTWDMICSGNQLNLCASVSVTQTGSSIIMTVTNQSNAILTRMGLNSSSFFAYFPSAPQGWNATASFGSFTSWAKEIETGIGVGGQSVFQFQFSGSFNPATFTFLLEGESLNSGGEAGDLDTGGDTLPELPLLPGDDISTQSTSVPEPGTMLLLGTGLAGMAVIRRRRRDEDME